MESIINHEAAWQDETKRCETEVFVLALCSQGPGDLVCFRRIIWSTQSHKSSPTSLKELSATP